MNTVYACTFIEKLIAEDDYQEGVAMRQTCMLAEKMHIQAKTLPGLLEAIGEHYGLTIDDVFIPGDEEDEEGVTRIGYNRLENGDAFEPTEAQLAKWKQGKLVLYLADYSFLIEKRQILPILEEEFTAAGIKTH